MLAGSSENNPNWDKKLGDKLSGPDVPQERWNTPPADMWDRIEADLPPNRKRRFVFLWWLGGFMLLAVIAVGGYNMFSNTEKNSLS